MMTHATLALAKVDSVWFRPRPRFLELFMSFLFGLPLFAMALALAASLEIETVSVDYQGDNGSVPPPHRRSTDIRIDADGSGTLTRLHGYDHSDSSQRFETAFVVSPEQRQRFAQRLQQLGLWDTRWRERDRVPVGGPRVYLLFSRGGQKVTLPAFPITRQQEAVDALRAEVLALVPETATAARQAWEQGMPDSE